MLRVLCAWCRQWECVDGKWVPSQEGSRVTISHGLCPTCARGLGLTVREQQTGDEDRQLEIGSHPPS